MCMCVEGEQNRICVCVYNFCVYIMSVQVKIEDLLVRVDVAIVVVLPCFSVSFILFISFIVPSLSMQQ